MIDADAVPALEGVPELLIEGDAIAGGTRRNRADAEGFGSFDDGVPEELRWLCCDAMTSGGLLAAVAPERAGAIEGAVIGHLAPGMPGTISVRASARAEGPARTR
jgi:selenide,water dikinase